MVSKLFRRVNTSKLRLDSLYSCYEDTFFEPDKSRSRILTNDRWGNVFDYEDASEL